MILNIDIPASIDKMQFDRGAIILNEFHKTSLKYPSYDLKFEELVKFYGSKAPFMLEGIADAIDNIGISDDKAESFMRRFANDMKGKIPDVNNWLSYQLSFGKYASNPSWYESISFVTSETARQVATGIQKHGEQVLSVLEAYNKYLPWLLIGGAGLFIYSIGGRAFKK